MSDRQKRDRLIGITGIVWILIIVTSVLTCNWLALASLIVGYLGTAYLDIAIEKDERESTE